GVVVGGAATRTLAAGQGGTGPFLALGQVIVTRATGRERLTMALAVYNLAGYAAAGLGAAAVARVGTAPRSLFALFLLSGLVQIAAYALLSSQRPSLRSGCAEAATPSRPFVRRIAAIFALPSFPRRLPVPTLI